MKIFLLLFTVFLFTDNIKASENFQFAPPPFNILNLRNIDIREDSGIDYVGMKIDDIKFKAVNFSSARTVRKWESGGFSWGYNFGGVFGKGNFASGLGSLDSEIRMTGMTYGLQPNFYFDLAGKEEDDFSLPFYFGPHINFTLLVGSFDYMYSGPFVSYKDTAYLTSFTMMLGWQFGIQAGINLGPVKFVPYVDFHQELGGSVSYSATMEGSTYSDSQSIKSTSLSATPGFDIVFRNIGLSLGGAVNTMKSTSGSGKDVKTTTFHLRWQTKFRSVCGI
ncbi:MAG TPA: hypothetical protein PK103_02485 [Elusimicrobiales bacterium]|nr:hypothetical protein [Elusimicrobiales bacterium]HPO94862.1 hypothetical protein [Elusimicrobiales bacterium]